MDQLDKEPGVNPVKDRKILTVKARPFKKRHMGPKGMGFGVPESTAAIFTDIRKPLVRSSPLATLDHCPRKFLYEYKLGIRPNRYESALTMGSIVHKILESMFLGKTETEALSVCESILVEEQEKLIEDAGPDGFLSTGEALESQLKKVEEDYHKARAVGLVFWKTVPFNMDEWEVLKTPDGDPMVEMILECEYPGITRPFRCPCDVALLNEQTGEVWIVDFKTTSFDPKVRAIPTKISAQLGIYRVAVQTHLDAWADAGLAPERKVVGSIHAIIKKPGIKFCKKDANFAAYVERLVQWYKDAADKDPDNPPMILDPHRFSGPLMTEELFGRLKQYTQACHAGPNIHHFYRAGESACLQYNRICPFMELCNGSPAMWPDIIERKFKLGFREDEEDRGEDL